jgi:chorismate-pyruvate lyase
VPVNELLDRFDRMLLTTDGTVTTLLEACTGEPIITRATRQSDVATLDEHRETTGCWWHPAAELLDISPPERLLARRVTLSGANSGIAYVIAEALVAPDRLPELVARGLVRPGGSLGRLLAANRLETRRELVSTDSPRGGAASFHLGVRSGTRLLRRTYVIVFGGRSVAVVSEWFCPGRLAASAPTVATDFVVDL